MVTDYEYDDDLTENISTRLSLFDDDSLEFQPLGGAVDEFISFAQHPEKRVWTGIQEIDDAMRGIAPGEFCQINGFAHNGKCTTRDTLITLEGGRTICADEVVVGDRLVGANGQTNTVVAVADNGVHDIYEVETYCGYVVRCTGNHPFLMADGSFIRADQLQTGDVLVGDSTRPISLNDQKLVELGQLLGMLVGDGSTSNGFSFTNDDPDIWVFMEKALAEHGYGFGAEDRYSKNIIHLTRPKVSTFRPWLAGLGVTFTTAPHKSVPFSVIAGSSDMQYGFLAGLLDTDGGVENGQLVWYSTSHRLLLECKMMLRRLGWDSRLSVKNGRYKGEHHKSYRLAVTLHRGAADLRYRLPLVGRKRWIPVEWKRNSGNRKNKELAVKSVTVCPPEPTVAIQVDGDHTHVTNGIVTHNTLLVVEFLLKNEGRPGIVFSPDETRVLVLIKLAAAVLGISAEEMERRVNQEDPQAIELLNDIAERFANLAVFEDPVTIHGMDRAYASVERAIGKPDYVVFDFADLLDEDVDLPAKLRLLKMWGKDHSVPMIVLVQSSKSMGGGGKSVTIESGSHDRGDSATFIIGVRRKINMLKDHVRQLEEKLEQTMNPTQAEKIIDKIRDIQQDMIPRHRDTITINLVKNKRPPSRLVEEVDFRLDQETGRLTPIVKLPEETEPDATLPMAYSTGKSARDLLKEAQQ